MIIFSKLCRKLPGIFDVTLFDSFSLTGDTRDDFYNVVKLIILLQHPVWRGAKDYDNFSADLSLKHMFLRKEKKDLSFH